MIGDLSTSEAAFALATQQEGREHWPAVGTSSHSKRVLAPPATLRPSQKEPPNPANPGRAPTLRTPRPATLGADVLTV